MSETKPVLVGYWPGKRWKQVRATYSIDGIAPTIQAEVGAHGNVVCILEEKNE